MFVCNPVAVGIPVRDDSGGSIGIGKYDIVNITTKECAQNSVRYDSTSVI